MLWSCLNDIRKTLKHKNKSVQLIVGLLGKQHILTILLHTCKDKRLEQAIHKSYLKALNIKSYI